MLDTNSCKDRKNPMGEKQSIGGGGGGGLFAQLASETAEQRKILAKAIDDDLIPGSAYERILDSLSSRRIKQAWLNDGILRIGQHSINMHTLPEKAQLNGRLTRPEQILARKMLKDPFLKTVYW